MKEIKTIHVQGQKFIVVKNTNGHHYPMGEILTFGKDFDSHHNGGGFVGIHMAEGYGGDSLKSTDCKFLYCNIEEIDDSIKEDLGIIEKATKRIIRKNRTVEKLLETGQTNFEDNIKLLLRINDEI